MPGNTAVTPMAYAGKASAIRPARTSLRPDGRRRQYRGAPRRDRGSRRDLPFRGRLPAGERTARSRGNRSRPNAAQSVAGRPGLFARVGAPTQADPSGPSAEKSARRACPWSSCRSPISAATGAGAFRRRRHGEPDDRSSRIRGAVVIARNTAFTYKGKPLDVKTIGRELNVRYVLEGSVQPAGIACASTCS